MFFSLGYLAELPTLLPVLQVSLSAKRKLTGSSIAAPKLWNNLQLHIRQVSHLPFEKATKKTLPGFGLTLTPTLTGIRVLCYFILFFLKVFMNKDIVIVVISSNCSSISSNHHHHYKSFCCSLFPLLMETMVVVCIVLWDKIKKYLFEHKRLIY